MKKLFQMSACVLLIMALFCACGMSFDPEAGLIARKMMTALRDNDVEAAIELMHPGAVKESDDVQASVQALCDYVAGRDTTELKQESINIHNQVGTNAGKYETGTFRAVLDDGTVLKVEYTYLNNTAGSGFTSFYLSIGT